MSPQPSQNDLSDEKVKRNVRDADLDELQTIFDRATPNRYDRADTDQKDRLGFLAQARAKAKTKTDG